MKEYFEYHLLTACLLTVMKLSVELSNRHDNQLQSNENSEMSILQCLLSVRPGDKIIDSIPKKATEYEIIGNSRIRPNNTGIEFLCRYKYLGIDREENIGFSFDETKLKIIKAPQ